MSKPKRKIVSTSKGDKVIIPNVDSNPGEALNRIHRGTGVHKSKKTYTRKQKHKEDYRNY